MSWQAKADLFWFRDIDWPEARLIRLLAADQRAELRDGTAAEGLARCGCALEPARAAFWLDVLGAALAEQGRFAEAEEAAEGARAAAEGDEALARQAAARAALYREGVPYRYGGPSDSQPRD